MLKEYYEASISRRTFLKGAVATGVGFALSGQPLLARAQEPVTIRLMAWGNPTEYEARLKTIEMFHAAHPNIRVEFIHTPDEYMTKLQTMLAGRDYPDIIFLGNGDIQPFVERGQLMPIDSFIERDGFDTSDIFPTNEALYNVNGVQYGFPVDAANNQLFFNKTMFAEAGVEPPPTNIADPNWTWDTFLEKALAVTDAAKNQWGYQVNPGFRPLWIWITANGGQFFNEDGTACVVNEEPAVEALQFLADLIHVHKVAPPLDLVAELGSAEMFQSGLTAMETWWPAIGRMRTNIGNKFEWDVTVHPAGSAGFSSAGGGTGHTISAFSEHPEEAWQFLKFVISPEAVTTWTDIMGIVPPLQSVAKTDVFLKPGEPPENINAFIDGNAYLRADPRHPQFVQARSIFQIELERLWLGGTSAQEVLDKVAKEVNRLL